MPDAKLKDLKQCPLCQETQYLNIENGARSNYWIVCRESKGGCGLETTTFHSINELIAYWNNRGQDELALRRILAATYGGPDLFCEDGELLVSTLDPAIDFLRDSPVTIVKKIHERAGTGHEFDPEIAVRLMQPTITQEKAL